MKRVLLSCLLILFSLGLIGCPVMGEEIAVYVDGSQLNLDVPPKI